MDDFNFIIYEDPVNVAVNGEPVPAIESGDPTLEDIVKWCDELLNSEELYKEAHREESRDPTLEDIVKWCDELLNSEELYKEAHREESKAFYSNEDDDTLFLDVSAEELEEFEREEMALNAPGSKRKRESEEEDANLQKKKCDEPDDITDLLCVTIDKLDRIEDSESQLRRFVLLSNLEQKIEQALLM